MMTTVTMVDIEAEIRDLKRRVGELEGAFTFLTQQVRAVHADLLGFRTAMEERFDRVEQRLDGMERRIGGVEQRLGGVEHELGSLRRDLPEIIAGAVGEALRRHG